MTHRELADVDTADGDAWPSSRVGGDGWLGGRHQRPPRSLWRRPLTRPVVGGTDPCLTGRPARLLPNEFIVRFEAIALLRIASNHLSGTFRRSGAAADDAEFMNLRGRTGRRAATTEPTARFLQRCPGS